MALNPFITLSLPYVPYFIRLLLLNTCNTFPIEYIMHIKQILDLEPYLDIKVYTQILNARVCFLEPCRITNFMEYLVVKIKASKERKNTYRRRSNYNGVYSTQNCFVLFLIYGLCIPLKILCILTFSRCMSRYNKLLREESQYYN